MSIDYAAGLSDYDDLGVCGIDEVFDKPEDVGDKVALLAEWLRQYKGSCVVHVGAGLSTSAGIRDFRGKDGVWTELLKSRSGHRPKSPEDVKQDVKVETSNVDNLKAKPFDEALPTISHLVLKALCDEGFVRHIISQNVDGLFLKTNLDRRYISELHGNFFLDECTKCRSRFIRSHASPTMRLQKSSTKCPRDDITCKGYLRDTILDWESPVPFNELRIATRESKRSLLHIAIGTSLQLKPSKELVRKPNKSNKYKLVVINLQPTEFDQHSNTVINYYADEVMRDLANRLDLNVPVYSATDDPTKDLSRINTIWKK